MTGRLSGLEDHAVSGRIVHMIGEHGGPGRLWHPRPGRVEPRSTAACQNDPFHAVSPLLPFPRSTRAHTRTENEEGTDHIGDLTDPSPVSGSVAATPAGLKAPQRQTL